MTRDEIVARLLCVLYPTPALLWPQIAQHPALKWWCIVVRSEKVEKVRYLIPGYGVRCSRKMLRENEEYRILRGIK